MFQEEQEPTAASHKGSCSSCLAAIPLSQMSLAGTGCQHRRRESGPIETRVSLYPTNHYGNASLGHMSREAFFFNPTKRYSVECPICNMWFRMPHHKRFSTPISVQEAEEALVIGYWVRDSIDDVTITLCQRHKEFLALLDGKGANINPSPPMPTTTMPVIGPVTNGNLSTSPPPVPVVKLPAIATTLEPPTSPAKEVATPEEKRSYCCPVCHRMAILGDVHLCG
jgi:hypothetical protein